MRAYYMQRTFSDGVKGGLSLSFANLTRQFIFGSNWKRIRIGVNMAVNTGNIARAYTNFMFHFGVCCGNVGWTHDSGNTTNWAGYCPLGTNGLWPTGALTYNANSGNPYISYTNERGSHVTKVGQTVTAVSIGAGQPSFPANPGALMRRAPYIFEMTKTSVTSSTLHSECPQSAAQMSIACPSGEFLELVESIGAVTPLTYGALVQNSADAMTTARESNGPYDTFNLAWDSDNVELEVYEIIAMRFN